MIYFGTRLSDNISRREPEGYLICLNVPVARTGSQEYLPSELGLQEPDNRLIPVFRPEEEVFSPACIASFEGMPVTDDHPMTPDGVTAENIRFLQKGHAGNIRRGAGKESDLLLADLMITDPGLIEEILGGKREISCGYNYTLCEEDGKFIQREIRGNHVAVVDAGRAGPRVSIRDQHPARPASLSGRQGRKRTAGGGQRAPGPGDAQTPGSPVTPKPIPHWTQTERSQPMKKNKSMWRARMMARMAKDGDVEGLAELITEMMDDPVAEAVSAAPATPAAPAAPVGDPVVESVVSAVAENIDPSADAEVPAAFAVPMSVPAAASGTAPAAAPAAPASEAPAAPVVVEAPENQPVLVDCGPEILAALNRIVELLSARGTDCNDPAPQDCDPVRQDEAPAGAVAETVAETAALTAEAVAGAVAEAIEAADPAAPSADEDPVEALVEEILEPATAAEEAEQIVSAVLEPETLDEDNPEQAADALRSALAAFRPQLIRMSPKERAKFNADVAARMRRLTARASKDGKPNPYAALRRASARRPEPDATLGQRIMAARNANLRR